jgi:hypothetical protein
LAILRYAPLAFKHFCFADELYITSGTLLTVLLGKLYLPIVTILTHIVYAIFLNRNL